MLLEVRAPSKRNLIRGCHAQTASSLVVEQLSGCFDSAKSLSLQNALVEKYL